MRTRAAVLISGNGSNLQALLEAQGQFDVRVVLASKRSAYGLIRARRWGIPVLVIPAELKKEALDHWLSTQLIAYRIDIICLAGFMRILGGQFVSQWHGRIINIHPSLLPKYKGLEGFESALRNGDRYGGVTVHNVVEAVDSGEFIAQRSFLIPPSHGDQHLALHIVEQKTFTEGMRRFQCGKIVRRWL